MAKTDPVPNRLFWQARRQVKLTRGQLADAANQEPAMATCEHELMTENFIGRIEQGRIGGNMCAQRLAALCARLGVNGPSDIGLSAGRRHPTDSAPARPRTNRDPVESADDVDGTGWSISEPNVLFRAARERLFGTREALADAANAHLGAAFVLSANDVGKIERGVVTWPRPPRRAAFRKVLNVETDAELGFFGERSPKLAPVTDDELERARLAILQRQSKAQTERESSAMARPNETAAARESGDESEGATLFDAMLRERHWQTPKAFRVQFTRAARELAEIEKDPEFLRLDDLSDRQFFRWRHGARPRPYACRILEHLFGTPIEELLRRPAATAGEQTTEPHQETWVDLGVQLAACRNGAGYTQGEFALLIYSSRSTIANVETGRQRANRNFWLSCDTACGTDGLLVRAYDRISREAAIRRVEDRQVRVASTPEIAQNSVLDPPSSLSDSIRPPHDDSSGALFQTMDLIERIQASDVSNQTLERLEGTVFELCCQYPYRDARELHAESRIWLSRIEELLRRPVGLRQHQELLVSAGWLALLIGCLDYDQGMRASAEAMRIAARQLGIESGHNEIAAWSHEMSAWFALTQGRYANVIAEAEAGQAADGVHSVQVQLLAQEAKALGRIGEIDALRRTLDRGADILSSIPRPSRSEHHFVVDPDKWYFYAMDAYRLAGDNELAETYAREVLAKGLSVNGVERAPMRMAEARLTLGVVAARSGELEEAVSHSLRALQSTRKSVPSLLMIAGEVDATLRRRFPREKHAIGEFHEKLRSVY